MAPEGKPSLISVIGTWSPRRKLSLLAVILISIALFAAIIVKARVADYSLLFANLSSQDAASVVSWLKERKVPYRLEDGGQAIFIPAEQVYESRLELASQGMPQGGGVGFEIFDKQSFGMTDFAQKVNFRRALQGELARTISSLGIVDGARVHLAIPEKRLFKDQQKEATASVILKLKPTQRLKESQVVGIIHLVAGSIEGLDADNVTVVDSSGRILSTPPRNEVDGPMSPGMMDYQVALERRLQQRAQSLLDRALGVENSVVRVTAEVDFSQQERTEEIYDPEGTVVRSEQSVQEKSGRASAAGVPGVQANQNGPAAGGGNSSTRNEETVNYEVSKVISHKVFPVGLIKQLFAAVLVSDRYVPEGPDGNPTYVPRNDKELRAIEDMVRNALGIDDARGDRIAVTSMPFENNFYADPQSAPEKVESVYQYLPYVKYGLLLLGALALYFMMIRPTMKTLKGEMQVATPMKTVEELEAEQAAELPPAPVDPTQRLRDQALQEQAPFAQIIKSWLREG